MVHVASKPCPCLLDAFVGSRRRKSHNDGVAEPAKCCPSVRCLERSKNHPPGFNSSSHPVSGSKSPLTSHCPAEKPTQIYAQYSHAYNNRTANDKPLGKVGIHEGVENTH